MKALFIGTLTAFILLLLIVFGLPLELPLIDFLVLWLAGSIVAGFLVAILRFLFLPVHENN